MLVPPREPRLNYGMTKPYRHSGMIHTPIVERISKHTAVTAKLDCLIFPEGLSNELQKANAMPTFGNLNIGMPEYPKIDFIKIDVEQMEREVLRGAVGWLEVSRPVIGIELQEKDVREWVDGFLNQYGYVRLQRQFNHTPTYIYTHKDDPRPPKALMP